jgi:hypothetical protein
MSRKIIPAAVAVFLLASTGFASAQAPSAQGAGLFPYQNPSVQSITPAPSYEQFNGYYNMAPTARYYGPAQRRRAAPENGAGW